VIFVREESNEEVESLKREIPEAEGLLQLERVFLKEGIMKGKTQPRALKLLSILIAAFFSLSIIFALSRWLEHPLIAESGFLRHLPRGRFLLYFLPLFFIITSILSLTFSNILLRADWRKIMREEENLYKNLVFSLVSENSALSEKWRIKEVYWSLRMRKVGSLIPWRFFLPLIVLAFLLLFLGIIWPTALPEHLTSGLVYGKPEKTRIDQTLSLLEPKVDLMLKSFVEGLIRRIDLLLRW